jgi:hypothetical protein
LIEELKNQNCFEAPTESSKRYVKAKIKGKLSANASGVQCTCVRNSSNPYGEFCEEDMHCKRVTGTHGTELWREDFYFRFL